MRDEAVQPIWVTRAAVAAGAFLMLGSAWQLASGSAQMPRSPTQTVIAQADRAALADAEAALRSAMADLESAKRQAERARRLLDEN